MAKHYLESWTTSDLQDWVEKYESTSFLRTINNRTEYLNILKELWTRWDYHERANNKELYMKLCYFLMVDKNGTYDTYVEWVNNGGQKTNY